MNIYEMLSEKSFLINFKASSKKHIITELCKLAEKKLNINSRTVIENLTKREKLGSTAVGNGVAIPHATEKTLSKPEGFIAILSESVDFNAIDEQPVDVIFLLLAPNNNGSQHLQALASVSRLLKNSELILKLRGCKSTESALAVISQSTHERAA